jgi:hypothetical protein
MSDQEQQQPRRPRPDQRARTKPRGRGPSAPRDPRKHAVELLKQADRLADLAAQLRREARHLNAALDIPVPEPSDGEGRTDGHDEQTARAPRPQPPVRRRRFKPASKSPSATRPETRRDPNELSDGARLMVTNLASVGTGREEILRLMRDDLGLENADAILERMKL